MNNSFSQYIQLEYWTKFMRMSKLCVAELVPVLYLSVLILHTLFFCGVFVCIVWPEQWRSWERTVPWESMWFPTAHHWVDGKLSAFTHTVIDLCTQKQQMPIYMSPNSTLPPRKALSVYQFQCVLELYSRNPVLHLKGILNSAPLHYSTQTWQTFSLSLSLSMHTMEKGRKIAQLCRAFIWVCDSQTEDGGFPKGKQDGFLWLFSWLTWPYQSPP